MRFSSETAKLSAVVILACAALTFGCGDDDDEQDEPDGYTVSTSTTGGEISPTSAEVEHGETVEFTLTPWDGHRIDEVTGCDGSLSENIYTTGEITESCTVEAVFEETESSDSRHTVDATAGEGGSIEPESVEVEHGEQVDFVVTPDDGYGIDEVTGCDGTLNGAVYITGDIVEPCTVEATFFSAEDEETHTVEATAGEGGVIAPEITEVVEGAVAEFIVVSDVGYAIDEVTGCDGSLDENLYTTGEITEPCTVEASFAEAEPVIDWTFETPGDITGVTHVFGGDDPEDDELVVASDDGFLHQLVAHNGDEEWDFQADDGFTDAVVLDGEHVYGATFGNEIYAVDRDDGAEVWSQEVDDTVYGSLAVDDQHVYVLTSRGDVYALDRQDGEESWTESIDNQINVMSGPIVADRVYVSVDGEVHAFERSDGTSEWTRDIGYLDVSPAFGRVGSGEVYVGDGDEIYALSSDDGSDEWSVDIGDEPYGRLAFFAQPPFVAPAVYTATVSGEVHAIESLTGDEIWSFEPPETWFLGDPAVGVQGVVYVDFTNPDDPEDPAFDIDEAGLVVIQDGEEAWRYEVDGDVTASPAVDDQRVYFGTEADGSDGTVYALELL